MKQRIAILVILLIMVFANTATLDAGNEQVYLIEITGEIDPGLAYQVEKAIGEAEEKRVDLILLEIDTYGGLVDSAIRIKEAIVATDLSTAAYVNGRAWSAGALIALSAEHLSMSPVSSMGAAETRPKEEKYISAVRKEFAATAESRGRDPLLAEAMVDSSIEIEGVVERDKLLSLTANEALEEEMIENIFNDRNELLEYFDLVGAEFFEVEVTAAERLARLITNPYLSSLLLIIGFIALFIELTVPGFGVGGTVGLISFALFFSGHSIIGDSGLGLAILFMTGILLLFLEIFVIPGFGIAGAGGIIAMITSIFFVFPTTEIALTVIAVVLLFSIIGGIIVFKFFGSDKFLKNIALEKTEKGYVAQTKKSDLLNKEGETISALRPAGAVEIDGERIDVVSESAFVEKGVKVKVVKVAGNRIVVREIKD